MPRRAGTTQPLLCLHVGPKYADTWDTLKIPICGMARPCILALSIEISMEEESG
jgi:hypothetical protein